ncbi:MAG TPA: metal ABC transporter ATP-binding protein [Clostridiaceae bacterium]|nr:metal ABC transporter ATP-binding protein [Clostridiaceae bacterium]
MSLITCKNLSFEYDGIPAVKNINFSVSDGDYLCVVGENGTGKSTLIKGLLRLKKPFQGEIILDNQLSADAIGYLPQQTIIQKDFPASVYEVVLSGCLNSLGLKPFFTRKEKNIAKNNMEKLGIKQIKNTCYRDLSGGQQQRVLLARALCATKKIIVLDEPVSGLDPIVTQELYELIHHINLVHKITIVMVSHDIKAAIKYASHILHLHNKQLFFGTTKDYLQSDIGQKFAGELNV